MGAIIIFGAIAALGIGIWIGAGAPGWPHKPRFYREHASRRSLNPIAWGRTPSRERQRVRSREDRPGLKLR